MTLAMSFWRLVAAATVLAIAAGTGLSATIIFKDGYIVSGRVKQLGQIQADLGTNQAFWIPNGGYVLDTGARVIFFSHSRVQQVDPKDTTVQEESLRLQNLKSRTSTLSMYPIVRVLEPTPWDQRWERTYKMVLPGTGKIAIEQRLALLTPQDMRVDAKRYAWSPWYLTSEFGPEIVRELLLNHPDLKPQNDAGDFSRRLRVFRFLEQAGWHTEADQELTEVQKLFPAEKEKIDAARQDLHKLEAVQRWQDIQRAHQAGRHQWVTAQLASLPRDELDETILTEVRALQAAYEATNKNVDLAKRMLAQLPDLLEPDASAKLRDAAAAIRSELNFDNVGRLEVFLNFAEQAERDRLQKRRPENGPSQLLALAVTGWLLGKEAAESKPEAAERLWGGRSFLLQYLRAEDPGVRRALLRHHEGNKSTALAIDEMSQLIGYLPPVAPLALGGGSPIELKTPSPSNRKTSPITYWLQLPPEYNHARACPVLIALADAGEKPRAMLDRLGPQAAENGYILAIPEWHLPLDEQYQYTPAEHAAVLNVLQELRRRLRIDSDRVFLAGYGQGGNMVFDVGLAHPDQFAGIIPICGDIRRYARQYGNNAQYLPMYMVDGDCDGDNLKHLKPILDKWIARGYPTMMVDYKGRGHEWFEGEAPSMFNWMNHKTGSRKRASGFPDLGKNGGGGPLGEEFQTMRPTDNRFYWLSTDAIEARNLNSATEWKLTVLPATLQGRIVEGNQIIIFAHGVKELTVRLGRDMIDFSKPVTVRVNGTSRMQNRKIATSTSTMLEELYSDGDRERLVWAKVDFSHP